MTIEEVELAVKVIDRLSSGDYANLEKAHMEQDYLHKQVLQAIAEGVPNARELAYAALKALPFRRWYM